MPKHYTFTDALQAMEVLEGLQDCLISSLTSPTLNNPTASLLSLIQQKEVTYTSALLFSSSLQKILPLPTRT